METTHKPGKNVRAYLLGTLDDREASELEANYFTDPACLRRIQNVEEGLIEDYFGDRLSPADRQRFESRYLEVPELRRKLDEVRVRLQRTVPRPRPAIWPSVRLALVCVGLFLVAAGTWRYVRLRSSPIRTGAGTTLPVPMATLSLRLLPGVAKGGAATQRELTIPAGGARVKVTLELPGQTTPLTCTVRLLALDADGRPGLVWTSQAVRSDSAGNIGEVSVEPDTSVLQPADYLAQVVTPDGSILETYVFRVNKRR
jgi:hypothetical protein